MRFSIGLLLLSLCCANGAHHSVSLRHVEVFVGPSGAESNGGSSSAPLNSCQRAVKTSHEWANQNQPF
jgi:hypothetical protein